MSEQEKNCAQIKDVNLNCIFEFPSLGSILNVCTFSRIARVLCTSICLLCFRYLVAGGLVDRVSRHSRALIETDFFLDQEHESPLLVSSFDLLARICGHLKRSVDQDSVNVHGEGGSSNVEQTSNESHLLSTLSATEASGAIGALYAAVALTPPNQKGTSPTPNHTFATPVRTLANHGLRLLKSIAELDLRILQVRLLIFPIR